MEEFRQILREAVEVLRKKEDENPHYAALDKAYNFALDDVIKKVINKIPN